MKKRHTRNLLTKAEVFGLSGSSDGATVNKKTLMNAIAHVTNHIVAVRDIFDCTGYMEGWNMKNSNFISDFIKFMMDDIDPRK